jgi:hypothetical protein
MTFYRGTYHIPLEDFVNKKIHLKKLELYDRFENDMAKVPCKYYNTTFVLQQRNSCDLATNGVYEIAIKNVVLELQNRRSS